MLFFVCLFAYFQKPKNNNSVTDETGTGWKNVSMDNQSAIFHSLLWLYQDCSLGKAYIGWFCSDKRTNYGGGDLEQNKML